MSTSTPYSEPKATAALLVLSLSQYPHWTGYKDYRQTLAHLYTVGSEGDFLQNYRANHAELKLSLIKACFQLLGQKGWMKYVPANTPESPVDHNSRSTSGWVPTHNGWVEAYRLTDQFQALAVYKENLQKSIQIWNLSKEPSNNL